MKCLEAYAAKAERGDRWAMLFFSDRIVGKPIERVLTAEAKEADLERFFTQLVDADDDSGDSSSDATSE